jgi:hypothetical protein
LAVSSIIFDHLPFFFHEQVLHRLLVSLLEILHYVKAILVHKSPSEIEVGLILEVLLLTGTTVYEVALVVIVFNRSSEALFFALLGFIHFISGGRTSCLF